jgi:hypothetical protein
MKNSIFWDIASCSLLKVDLTFHRFTWRYIAEDGTLHNHRCENLRLYEYNMYILVCVCVCVCVYNQTYISTVFHHCTHDTYTGMNGKSYKSKSLSPLSKLFIIFVITTFNKRSASLSLSLSLSLYIYIYIYIYIYMHIEHWTCVYYAGESEIYHKWI